MAVSCCRIAAGSASGMIALTTNIYRHVMAGTVGACLAGVFIYIVIMRDSLRWNDSNV